jgi:peptide deformylase
MAKLVPENHTALHGIAEEVPLEDIGTPKLKKILKDMREALFAYESEGFTGVAIAAPQIGVPLRMFIVEDTAPDKDGKRKLPTMVAINPEIIKLSKKKRLMTEGCLSVRDRYGSVERAERATIRAYDEHGKRYERGGSGLLAQIFQHECDHLDGTLFVDRAVKIVEKEEVDGARGKKKKGVGTDRE